MKYKHSKKNKALIEHSRNGLYVEDGIVYSPSGKIRSPNVYRTKQGYICYSLCVTYEGRPTTISVARLVAYQKYGDDMFLPGMVVRHLDGDTSNFKEENIAIGTMSENMMDAPEEQRRRTACYASGFLRKYSEELEQQICQAHQEGMGYGSIGKLHDIPKSSIRSILLRRKKL